MELLIKASRPKLLVAKETQERWRERERGWGREIEEEGEERVFKQKAKSIAKNFEFLLSRP